MDAIDTVVALRVASKLGWDVETFQEKCVELIELAGKGRLLRVKDTTREDILSLQRRLSILSARVHLVSSLYSDEVRELSEQALAYADSTISLLGTILKGKVTREILH